MAFPTTPTTAASTLLSSTTTVASTTHTFPSLTTLAPAAGDLIIAICVQYQGGTAGAEFSAWGASLTETRDDATVTALDMAVGVAHKVATGSETGTFTVTSAHSFISVQFLMRIPAATWHGTTIPEVAAVVRATNAVPNPGSLDPANWAAEDTLWIAVYGHSETSTTGTAPVITTAPTNYSGALIVARAADAVGNVTGAVAFRAVNAASEDAGVWTVTNATHGNGAASAIAVRPLAATSAPAGVATVAAGCTGGPVAFDAVAPGATGTGTTGATSLTWQHTCAASATHLLVGATCDVNPDTGFTMSATYNTAPMTSLGTWHTGGATAGFLQVWSLAAPATGSALDVVVTVSTSTRVNAGSISFTKSVALSAVQSTTSAGATANPSADFTGAISGNMVAGFLGCGITSTQTGSFTQRYNHDASSGGQAAGVVAGSTIASSGTVTDSFTAAADSWAIALAEVQASGATVVTGSAAPAGVAIVSATALNAAVTTSGTGTSAPAGAATVSAVALNAAATVKPAAAVATVPAAAPAVTAAASAYASAGSAAAVAVQPAVTTAGTVNAFAQVATVSAVATAATVAIAPNASAATVSAVAPGPAAAAIANAIVATVLAAAASARSAATVNAGAATVLAAGSPAAPAVTVSAVAAAIAAVAVQPAVTTTGSTNAHAGAAAVSAVAPAPVVAIGANAGAAAVSSVALKPAAGAAATAGVAVAGTDFPLPGTPTGPVTISSGGTYTGLSIIAPDLTSAITINTASAVTIDRATIYHAGAGIWAHGGGSVTVTNSTFIALPFAGNPEQQAINAGDPLSALIVEHNTFKYGHGVQASCPTFNSTQTSPLSISCNDFINIGRYSQPGVFQGAIHLDKITAPDGKILWNRVTNHYGSSWGEDIIGLANTLGTSGHPIEVAHCMVNGAYPASGNGASYTGGAFDLADIDGGYISCHHCYALNYTNNGFMNPTNVPGVTIDNCAACYDGLEDDTGATVSSTFGWGLTVKNLYTTGTQSVVTNCRVGHRRWNGSSFESANYQWENQGTQDGGGNTTVTADSTEEAALIAEFEASVVSAGVTIGPVTGIITRAAIRSSAGVAVVGAVAPQPSVTISGTTNAPAGVAAVSAAAAPAAVKITANAGAATVSAAAAAATAAAGLNAAAAAVLAVSRPVMAAVTVNAGVATVASVAPQPTVTVSGSATAHAGVATVAAAVPSAAANIGAAARPAAISTTAVAAQASGGAGARVASVASTAVTPRAGVKTGAGVATVFTVATTINFKPPADMTVAVGATVSGMQVGATTGNAGMTVAGLRLSMSAGSTGQTGTLMTASGPVSNASFGTSSNIRSGTSAAGTRQGLAAGNMKGER